MSDNSNIYKIWGERRRMLLTKQCEIDLLYLKANTFSSKHNHKNKINRFYVIEGEVRIETEFGTKFLKKDQSFEVRPPLIHRFYALRDSIMVELAYVEDGLIQPTDIQRFLQGGRYIEGRGNLTEDTLRKEGLL